MSKGQGHPYYINGDKSSTAHDDPWNQHNNVSHSHMEYDNHQGINPPNNHAEDARTSSDSDPSRYLQVPGLGRSPRVNNSFSGSQNNEQIDRRSMASRNDHDASKHEYLGRNNQVDQDSTNQLQSTHEVQPSQVSEAEERALPSNNSSRGNNIPSQNRKRTRETTPRAIDGRSPTSSYWPDYILENAVKRTGSQNSPSPHPTLSPASSHADRETQVSSQTSPQTHPFPSPQRDFAQNLRSFYPETGYNQETFPTSGYPSPYASTSQEHFPTSGYPSHPSLTNQANFPTSGYPNQYLSPRQQYYPSSGYPTGFYPSDAFPGSSFPTGSFPGPGFPGIHDNTLVSSGYPANVGPSSGYPVDSYPSLG